MIENLKPFKVSEYLLTIEDCVQYLIEIAKFNDKELFLSAVEDVVENLKASVA